MIQESIDVFCHCLPPEFCDAANKSLDRPLRMFERAQRMPVMVDVDARLRLMDEFPGYRQVLSLASPTVDSLAGPGDSPVLAQIGNDSLAAMVSKNPDRFPGFIASLPMNNTEAAIRETERAVNDLSAVGIQIYTNVNGQPLDRPEYLQVIEHAAELGIPIWMHPIRPMSHADYLDEPYSKFDMWWALGWPYETSIAMARLVFSGLFDRWPDLVLITHHCGGMIPMMEGRLDSGLELLGTRNPPHLIEAVRTELKEKPIQAFRRFYADTASFGSKSAIECAQEFFGLERMLFATDMPFDPEQGPGYIRSTLKAISDMEISDDERNRILSGNACRLMKLK